MKKTVFTALTLMGASATLLLGSNSAQAALIYDNIGTLDSAPNIQRTITSFAITDDFTLTEAVNLTDFTFWAYAGSGDTNSSLNDNIGWAIFNDNAGTVGSLITSGTDSSVTTTETGLTSNFGNNILQLDGDFGSTINLDAGTYWISFRDGAWGSASDGSTIFWASSTPSTVGSVAREDSNEANPTFPDGINDSLYFQLSGDVVASATTPEPSTLLGLLAVGSIGALVRRKKG
ncbi:MAG: PEP-CTERM sorting domain-containing protein [Crocosphaera sp.]